LAASLCMCMCHGLDSDQQDQCGSCNVSCQARCARGQAASCCGVRRWLCLAHMRVLLLLLLLLSGCQDNGAVSHLHRRGGKGVCVGQEEGAGVWGTGEAAFGGQVVLTRGRDGPCLRAFKKKAREFWGTGEGWLVDKAFVSDKKKAREFGGKVRARGKRPQVNPAPSRNCRTPAAPTLKPSSATF
jgi:hypothetical protein